MPFLSQSSDGMVLLALYVQPKASRTKVVGLFDGCLKIAVAAPPVDGKANEAVVKFFCKKFHLPRRDIVVKAGAQSRRKIIGIRSLGVDVVRGKVEEMIGKNSQ